MMIMTVMIMIPRCSMYGIFTHIWVIFRANVGKYSIHGAYGIVRVDDNDSENSENSDNSSSDLIR